MFMKISTYAGVGMALALALGLSAGIAQAAGSVAWTAPANNSTFAVGTLITPSGVANATGVVGGSGLDLAFVLDYSGSMGLSRRQTQRDAATALLNAVPAASSSVAIVGFGSNVQVLTQLTPVSTGKTTLETQLANLFPGPSGGTNTAGGITLATGVLSADNNGRDKQMVVITDGFPNSQTAAENAASAANTGTPSVQVNTVGLPGTNFGNQQGIATAGGGTFVTAGDLQQLIDIFTGTSGNLVGIDRIDVTLPDSTLLSDVPLTSGLGNFDVTQAFALALGNNFWTVDAYFTDGGTAQATLNVIGVAPGPNVIPLPAAAWLLLSGIAGLGVVSRKRRRA